MSWRHRLIAVAVGLFPCWASAAELLVNAGSAAAWKLETPPNNATLSEDDGALRIDVRTATQQSSAVQLFQEGKTLEAGRKYVLRFSAKASERRNINIAGQTSDPPYTFLYRPSVQIGTAYRAYEYTILSKRATEGKGRLPVFMVGSTAGTIWIRDASVQEVGDGPSAPAQTPVSVPSADPPATPDNANATQTFVTIPLPDDTKPVENRQQTADAPAQAPANPEPVAEQSPQAGVKFQLEALGGSKADIRREDDGDRIDIQQLGTEKWSVQIYRTHDQLAAGRYQLSFLARADRARPIELVPAQEHTDPFARLTGGATVQIATAWQRYVVKFDVPATSKVIRCPVLILGEATGTIWIKDCTLTTP